MTLASFDSEKLPFLRTGRILKAQDAAVVSEAVDILNRAREEAAALHREAQEMYESEKARGYAEGIEAGRASAIKHHLDTISATLDYLATSRDQMVETMLVCLRKMLFSLPPEELAMNLAARALESLREQAKVTIHVHPEDFDHFSARLDSLRGEQEKGWLQVAVSRTVKRGGCVLESQIGLVDASAETQIAAIHEALKRSL